MVDLNSAMSSGSSFMNANKITSLGTGLAEFSDKTIPLLEPKTKQAALQENMKYNPFVAEIEGKYTRAKEARYFDESRWLLAYRNFRGLYGPDVQFTATEKSRAFVKETKMKVTAAVAQIVEVVFGENKIPIGVSPTRHPLGIEEFVHFDPKQSELDQQGGGGALGGQAPQGPQVSATIARPSILQNLGPLQGTLDPIKDKLKSGTSGSATAANYEPAKRAAELMNKKIQDQLEEANANKTLRSFIFEFALLGTGVYKGPILKDKEYPHWTEDGKYEPLFETVADCTNVSLWDAYPDPEARKMEDCEYFIQRHRLSKSQLRQLKKRPFFRPESIDEAIAQGPSYEEEYWETTLRDSKSEPQNERYEALEFWGLVDKEFEEITGLDIPEEYKDFDEVQVNAWICNGQLLRLVFNPYTPVRIPYYIAPYEVNPYSLFGIGVAENMADMQLLMNGFARILVDNAVLSSNVIFEINETNLTPGQDFDLYPGKQFKTQGQPGQSIFATKFPNVTQECILVFDKFRQIADEATGLPSYAHGISGVMNTGRTAAGMSMLMGAADKTTKSVVRNLDDYLFAPLGKALYAFNMQFNFDKEFIGDVEIVALGTESLMRNEVRSQKLLQFLQLTGNPIDAPWVKRDYILRELAKSMDLEPDLTVNDSRTAMIQAEMLKNISIAQGIPPGGQEQGGNPASVPSPTDATGNGGGNIAPGQASTPGDAGFTGSGGGQNSAAPQNPKGGAPAK
jgi:hypothetical protein